MREDEGEGGPEGFLCQGVHQGENKRYDNRSGKIGEQGEGGQILDRPAHLTGDNRCRSSGRHDETEHESLRHKTASGQPISECICAEAEDDLHRQYDPMPFMKPQIKRIDLAKGEKEHEENEPGQDGLEGLEPWVENGSYEHAQPEGVTVKDRF